MVQELCPVCSSSVTAADSICPACGFKLSGSTQSFKPVTFNVDDATALDNQVKGTLRVLRGPQIGTIYTIGESEKTIGRNPQCDIFLNDMTVSRLHAIVKKEGGEFIVSDQNSFNGLWVNDKSVSEAALTPGDVVQIGVFCLVFETN